ncbi:hypothetical protein D8X55_01925 [Malacoplasma penetrans]|uniref:hypothetical protein n=1 Tax=Malacoplasma penetrans TaxID=28227 RepID=UPI0005D1092E|nr:hypothetical protein [Malacoplasma penetrans]RXY97025.1 hypothetical protein D8X55_01925 [Malacoplasma penetrans]
MNLKIFSFLQATTSDPGNFPYYGEQSWVYYLLGGIFTAFTLLSLWYTWRVRNSKAEYESISVSFNWFKRFWYVNRFSIMIMITIVLGVIAVSFFLVNSVIVSQN